jgi:hypothetical protein
MKRLRPRMVLLLAAVAMSGGEVLAQARGPSAQEVREHGQYIVSEQDERKAALEQARQQAREEEEREQALLRDPAVRAARIAEMEALLRRLPGRFRIDGLVESGGPLPVVPGMPPIRSMFAPPPKESGKITGVADCVAVGVGVGVHCIFNATWPTIETYVASPGGPLPMSELLRTFNPASLMIGIDADLPGIRALMVNSDSLAHIWVGKLNAGTLRAPRTNRCLQRRCLQPLEISAEPDGETVTIQLRAGITLTLTMYRDPEARAEKPMKLLKVR